MTTTSTHTVLISCACTDCETNAAHVGAPFPLAARITVATAAMLKITARNATRASKTHGVVFMAHQPVVGAAQRLAVPVTA